MDIAAHLLLYIYEVPDVVCKLCGSEPANPNKWAQRATIYFAVFLWAELDIRNWFNRVVASIMVALICNEVLGHNQDWGVLEFISFAVCFTIPYFEIYLTDFLNKKRTQ